MMYNIISSGSEGNCIIYFDSIMVDIGVPYSCISQYADKIQLVLISHIHQDHMNLSTIRKLAFERPAIRFGCGRYLAEHLKGIRNVDVYEIGKWYDYGAFKISPVKLYHDVENMGFRLFKDGKKIFHATDTVHLQGISAKGYDLYAIEANYDADTIYDIIGEKRALGEYAHQVGSINSHLSRQQAQDFVLKNAGENYEFIMLHQSKSSF